MGTLGTKSVTMLSENLKKAVEKKDKTLLEKSIREAVSAGLSGLADDIQEARKTLSLLEGGTKGLHIPAFYYSSIR